MAKDYTISLPKGYQLTLIADGFTAGSYTYLDCPGNEPSSPIEVSTNSVTQVGPFNESRSYRLTSTTGCLAHSQSCSGVFTRSDEVDLHKYIAMRW